eukprot:3480171-Ditylum_brightwellii.AAC.2
MDNTLYYTLSTIAYTPPVRPTRGTLTTRATLVDRDVVETQYKKEKAMYDDHNTEEEAIKTQIQEAVEDIYLSQIKNKYTNYMGVPTRDIIDHLLDRYGKITP